MRWSFRLLSFLLISFFNSFLHISPPPRAWHFKMARTKEGTVCNYVLLVPGVRMLRCLARYSAKIGIFFFNSQELVSHPEGKLFDSCTLDKRSYSWRSYLRNFLWIPQNEHDTTMWQAQEISSMHISHFTAQFSAWNGINDRFNRCHPLMNNLLMALFA